MDKHEKVIKGLESCILHNPDDHARCMQCPYESNCVNRLKMDALELLKEQQEIIDELNTAIKEWRNLKWFTPYEVGIAMVTHGQKDPQFKWGETIKYSPAEVEKILNEVGKNEN